MTKEQLVKQLTADPDPSNTLQNLPLSGSLQILVYPKSIIQHRNSHLFIGKLSGEKHLWIVATDGDRSVADLFEGAVVNGESVLGQVALKQCPLNHRNAGGVRELLPFTRPTLLGLHSSIGCGDRLGITNPAHVRAVAGSGLRPVLAQQSVRELERTKREAEDVVDAATWAVFQEGFKDGFGADADHLKTTEDIDRYAKAGFTMYTLDIGAYVVNEAARMPIAGVRARAESLPWDVLEDSVHSAVARYADRRFSFGHDVVIAPNKDDVLRAFVKYGAGIVQTVKLCTYLSENWGDLPHEIELSVDETDTPTSPLEHFIIANELKRLGIHLVSLAPRFIGDFEKGVDYRGDLDAFRSEYVKHLRIAEEVGPYKISIHSGSDKFSLYPIVGSVGTGAVHVKTAGTSYLEALRAVAAAEPGLFREILDCARANFPKDRMSYHVTAQESTLRATKEYSDVELQAMLENNDARQILHVTFGAVLTVTDEQGKTLFKERIMRVLQTNEDLYYRLVVNHFRRHIEPLSRLQKKQLSQELAP